jgi:hypothetical protein
MRRLIVIGALLCSGCLPTEPESCSVTERIVPVSAPLHHNIPVVLPDGSVGFMCETQPRQYLLPQGGSEWTRDHYIVLGNVGCPDIPIK